MLISSFAPASQPTAASCAAQLLATLNRDFLSRHTLKEMAMWERDMGLARNVPGVLTVAEEALKNWTADPDHLRKVEKALGEKGIDPFVGQGLKEWQHFFRANALPDLHPLLASAAKVFGRPKTKSIFSELLEIEEKLHEAKSNYKFTYTRAGVEQTSTATEVGLLVKHDPDEGVRRSAHESLLGLEKHLLQNGLIAAIKARNRLARRLGFEDYYAWKVQTNERMTKRELFTIIDRFEERTRSTAQSAIEHYQKSEGEKIRRPWNFNYLTEGDLIREKDPYFPLGQAMHRFGRAFTAVGIDFQKAYLVIDPLNRPTKYQNGFIRAPIPSHMLNKEVHVALRANFSSNAIPTQVGAGLDAYKTIFHEAGHCGDFANYRTASVAAAQEEAPSSVARAETQSMFLDSFLDDPMFLSLYAKDEHGKTIPWDLVRRSLEETHRLRAHSLRSILTVPYMERAMYEMSDEQLTAENLLKTAREIEQRLFQTDGSGRPVLSIPHISSLESSAYYHGYFLAELGVYATHAHFIAQDGYVVNNPKVGPAITRAYWNPGNSISFPEMIASLTGKPFSEEAAVAVIRLPMETFLSEAHHAFDSASRYEYRGPIRLNGDFSIHDGDTQIASTLGGNSFESMADAYAAWISRLQRRDP